MEERLAQLSERLANEKRAAEQTLDTLKAFTGMLYDSIEFVISELIRREVTTFSKPQRNKLDDGRESLSFNWKRYGISFFPYNDVAFPNPEETRVPNTLRQTKSGKLVVFLHAPGLPEQGIAIYHFDVFSSGAWSAWGFGYPIFEQSITEEILHRFALTFFEYLSVNMPDQWMPLRDIRFSGDVKEMRPPLGFKVKSNEQSIKPTSEQ